MVDDIEPGPRVAPSRPKGSGSKAPWIVLGLIVTVVLAVIVSIGLALFLLRANGGG